MKLSEGVTRLAPSIAFVGLFLSGAVIQAIAMRQTDMGPAYIVVLGLETILTFLLSALWLREAWSTEKAVAVLLIVAGVILLRRS